MYLVVGCHDKRHNVVRKMQKLGRLFDVICNLMRGSAAINASTTMYLMALAIKCAFSRKAVSCKVNAQLYLSCDGIYACAS